MDNTYPIRKGFYILGLYRLCVSFLLLPLRDLWTSLSPLGIQENYILLWISLLLIITLLSFLIYQAIRDDRRKTRIFFYTQLVIDVIFVEALIFITGGIESWFSFLLILITILSAIIIGRKGGYIVGTLAGILYGVMIDLQYYRILPISFSPSYQFKEFFYNLGLNLLGIYLTAFLMGYLLKRLEKTSETLMKRDTDLKELVKFQSEVIDNIPSGLFTTDNEGRITLFNTAAEKITGRSFEEIKDRPINEVFPFVSNPPTTGRSQGVIYRDNEIVHIGMNISVYTNSRGQRVGYIGTFQDVTKIIQMEEEIKKKERLAAIGELSASIAHELRNPLASIKSSFEMIREDRLPVETKKRLMDIAISEMDRLNSIVRDFLMYSNPRPPEKHMFVLSDVVSEVTDSMLQSYPQVRVTKEIHPGIEIYADERKIRQVLWNILSNAVDATDASGHIKVSLTTEGQKAIIRIADDGCGIEREDLHKVFYPFFSKKKNGTGLGLSIAYRIVDEHGGNIFVKSEPSKGSEFTVILPLKGDDDEQKG